MEEVGITAAGPYLPGHISRMVAQYQRSEAIGQAAPRTFTLCESGSHTLGALRLILINCLKLPTS